MTRTHKGFLKRLFELEVPEIHSGTVEIRAIAREAGSRSKVAVGSRQEGLDPVGATVGQRGARVQAVVAELGGEKIDVIPWNDDAAAFVANALSPAQVLSVDIDVEHRIANVTVPERMLSLAIGREGQNARLAARLTGWRIDIRSDVSVAEAKAAEDGGDAVAVAGAVVPVDVADAADAPEAATVKKPRARAKKADEAAPASEVVAPAGVAPEVATEAAIVKKPRARAKKAVETETGAAESVAAAPDAPPAQTTADEAPAKKPRARSKKVATEEVAS